MERNYKISIPELCKEDWNKMTPNENGRFCMSCSKTVTDFTSMLPEEIQHFFIQNQNNAICGRFKNSQLETITIQIPSQVLYTQTNYYKMFVLAMFISMGTTLFSCSDKDGNKNKIDKIEIIDNTEQNENEFVSKCYGHQIESKKVSPEKPAQSTMMGMIAPANPIQTGSFVYHTIYNSKDLDVLPVPENGIQKFYAFFAKNYNTPNLTEKFNGEIEVLLVVEEDGSLSNFTIGKNIPKEIEEETIRVLEKAPKWIPGKLKNRIVRSTYVLPITIK
ncbi:energy transducer TonB [Flavobacterium sp.]|uniref:energy transducer TonB n=1 Tax=Flavobacterium sp. TaxID=239 RepID=UPI0031DC4106